MLLPSEPLSWYSLVPVTKPGTVEVLLDADIQAPDELLCLHLPVALNFLSNRFFRPGMATGFKDDPLPPFVSGAGKSCDAEPAVPEAWDIAAQRANYSRPRAD